MTSLSDYSVQLVQDGFPVYELQERSTSSAARICPQRGGIMTGLVLHGQSLLYLDEATFRDPDANIRGGNPILFPICGQLPDKQYEWQGVTYPMANHGVARVLPWEVVSTSQDDEASLTLRLTSNEQTLQSYPFAFELLFTYRLQGGRLRLEQQYINHSEAPMPMVAGFHPYFATSSKALVYDTDATQYLDYNDGRIKPVVGAIDLGELVESVALLDAEQRQIAFPLNETCTVRLSYSEVFKYIVLWSVQGKPFVCVEPWMAKNEELVVREELPMVGPGEMLEAQLTFACENR
ncbi:aldose epimerase [Paenibacillus sp. 1P07SE]|uniref:aldose epimerase family protein n=1 Tax=Paenibacillus sp. 1P07SE TaxID=3132209 RepID=UPI0039A70146